ncbi:28 kDa ribonucleoprotein, chloroplastic-like [Teleopsis dalmanni]|uniref:28 kDa ribonucleoprotein, chloroplastic-like n=1 Tax=Teleopsis dalmanni TaxID=139649 RepID=UPI0018CD629C|nr:28 kDa ribonucleoprotein, chloroplastic-like [Teleopsis dalmanni]XP_037953270.1 28 kDa ribonucleoprotein, chloroplastic-like [Teleopsis dalmanni]
MSGATRNIYKLFVGNLPWTIGNKELQLYFSKFGHVSSAQVVFDKQQGLSKSYGFVTFSTRDGFNSASNQNTHTLEGRVLNIQAANN